MAGPEAVKRALSCPVCDGYLGFLRDLPLRFGAWRGRVSPHATVPHRVRASGVEGFVVDLWQCAMSESRRFVLPVDQPVLLDSNGFLLPVSDGGGH